MLDTKAHLGPNKNGFMLGIICCHTNAVLKTTRLSGLKQPFIMITRECVHWVSSAGFNFATWSWLGLVW